MALFDSVGKGFRSWTTRDLITTAMVAAAFGALLWAYDLLWGYMAPILGPVGVMVLYGIYFLAGTFTGYIIRKPGAAILGETLAAVIEVLAGGTFGVAAISAGLLQGLGAEIAFGVGVWRVYRLPVLLLAGVLAAVAAFFHDGVLFGYFQWTGATWLAILSVMVASGAVLGGWLAKVLGDALARTGVLAPFGIYSGRRLGRRTPRRTASR